MSIEPQSICIGGGIQTVDETLFDFRGVDKRTFDLPELDELETAIREYESSQEWWTPEMRFQVRIAKLLAASIRRVAERVEK